MGPEKGHAIDIQEEDCTYKRRPKRGNPLKKPVKTQQQDGMENETPVHDLKVETESLLKTQTEGQLELHWKALLQEPQRKPLPQSTGDGREGLRHEDKYKGWIAWSKKLS